MDLYLPAHWLLQDALHVSLNLPLVFVEQEISSISWSIIFQGALQTSVALTPYLFPNTIILEQVLSCDGRLHDRGTLSSHPKLKKLFLYL